jgi:hypothetical protein
MEERAKRIRRRLFSGEITVTNLSTVSLEFLESEEDLKKREEAKEKYLRIHDPNFYKKLHMKERTEKGSDCK